MPVPIAAPPIIATPTGARGPAPASTAPALKVSVANAFDRLLEVRRKRPPFLFLFFLSPHILFYSLQKEQSL